jgi:hypothetical protein
MSENDKQSDMGSNLERRTTASQLDLTILGVVLFGMGLGRGLGAFLYAAVAGLSWPFERLGIVGLLVGIGLLVVIPTRIMRAIPKVVARTVVGIWLFGGAMGIWWWLSQSLGFGWDNGAALRMMMAMFGLLLIGSNGWDKWIIRRLRDAATTAALWGRVHAKATLIVICVGLWFLNPYNSNETCVQASRVAENHGAYRSAIVFATLARDTFPTQTWCGTCFGEIQDDLTARIDYLEYKIAGKDVNLESSDDEHRMIHETPPDGSWKAIKATER